MATPAWDGRPQLRADLVWVMDGFNVLSRMRQGGGWGIAPITVEAVKAYLDLIGCHSPSERVVFLEFVLELDSQLLDWSSKRGGCSGSNADAAD